MGIEFVSFDVWNTLLDISTVFRFIAHELTSQGYVKMDEEATLKTIYRVYEKMRDMKRREEIQAPELLPRSQYELANALGISRNLLLRVLSQVFGRLGTEPLIPGALETVKFTKELGLKVGIVGNVMIWPSAYTRLVLERTGISRYVDEQVYSDECRVLKPYRAIFYTLCRSLDVDCSRGVHVGNSLVDDVAGALACNMIAIWINTELKDVEVIANRIYGIPKIELAKEIIEKLARK